MYAHATHVRTHMHICTLRKCRLLYYNRIAVPGGSGSGWSDQQWHTLLGLALGSATKNNYNNVMV